jgi:hypothetical protein
MSLGPRAKVGGVWGAELAQAEDASREALPEGARERQDSVWRELRATDSYFSLLTHKGWIPIIISFDNRY